MAAATKITSWRGCEARTHDGQLMRFWAPSDLSPQEKGRIKAAIGRTKGYTLPETHRVNVEHGGYGQYSRYDIKQTKYAGGGAGFIEALEVQDAPDGRCPHIVFHYATYGNSAFWEFETQKLADAAFEKCWGNLKDPDHGLSSQPGFIREVFCDILTPWFYAVGNQELVVDWAFPEYHQDHPYFTPGKLYLVVDQESGDEKVKRCIGSRVVDNYHGYERYIPVDTVLVFWDDGTHFSSKTKGWMPDEVPLPKALNEASEEVAQALGTFRELLATEPQLANEFLGKLSRHRAARPRLG